MTASFLSVSLFGFLACKPVQPSSTSAGQSAMQLVEYDPDLNVESSTKAVLERLPNATLDQSLQETTQLLIAASRDPMAPLSVQSMLNAEKATGYPGQAHFLKVMNGGAFPYDSIAHLREKGPVDIGWSSRKFGDGKVLWIVGWAKHVLEIDPLPLTIPLDGVVPLRIGDFDADRALLYIASPDRPVDRIELLPGAHRWIQDFHVPGEYRMEVLLQDTEGAEQYNEIALLFSVYVDSAPPVVGSTSVRLEEPNPMRAEEKLFVAVNELRRQRGLHPLKAFPLFTPLAREHSALMASTKTVQHRISGVTDGVPSKAAKLAHPRANHFQNVAAALTADEALALAKDSPGHFQVFLCETCTHMSVGVALEPTLRPNPRLYVTWEVLEFPRGEPQAIEKLNRDF